MTTRISSHLSTLLAGAALVASPPVCHGKQPITDHTFNLESHQKSPPARIEDMRWLAGRWRGTAMSAQVEEVWSAPEAGAMMGMYRMVRDGKHLFLELMTIVEHEGSLVLRLKHFNPDLTGWEEKDETVDFPLVAIEPDAVHFRGLSLHPRPSRSEPRRLVVYLAVGEEGEIREERFEYESAELPEAGSGAT